MTPTQVIAFLHSYSGPLHWTLARVKSATGSTPRKVGALMAIADSGQTYGSIGGGLGEAHLLAAVKQNPGLQNLQIDLRGGPNSLGICGGQMQIDLVRPSAKQLSLVMSHLNAGFPAAPIMLGFSASHELMLQPSPTLVIAGLGHCGVALAELARGLGYLVFGHDDRADVLCLPPSCEYTNSWEALLPRLEAHVRPNVVLLTRSNALDVEALQHLYAWGAARCGTLNWVSAFGYLGMMGSQRRIRSVQNELAFDLAGVHAPVGLQIGAETPMEIAVSIVAALIAEKSGDSN